MAAMIQSAKSFLSLQKESGGFLLADMQRDCVNVAND